MSIRPEPPAPPTLGGRKADNRITQTRHYRLLTPLFGGGVDAGETDPLTVISGTAVRGQLRFWWRATRGGQFSDLAQLKEAEELLWGGPSTKSNPRPSQVNIEIEITRSGQAQTPFTPENRYGDGRVAPPYAAFPLQPSDQDRRDRRPPKKVQSGVEFGLKISFPDNQAQQADVAAALWAWETFGGIGARTRRGFGALQLQKINGTPQPQPRNQADAIAIIERGLQKHVVNGTWPANVPHLQQDTVFEVTKPNVAAPSRLPTPELAAWTFLIDKLKEFRQQRNPGTDPKAPNKPGRSKWPEPEAIRQLTGQRHRKHGPLAPNFVKFPRAAFGLPIVFQFQQRDKDRPFDSYSDPRKTLLRLDEYERLASPLLLRPLTIANNQAVGLAIVLDGTGTNLTLTLRTDEERDRTSVIACGQNATLTPTEQAAIKTKNGSAKLLSDSDVINAFLDFLIK